MKVCSRILPKPIRIWTNGEKPKLRYIIYPNLSNFKKSCQVCKFRIKKKNQSFCRLKDNAFRLKFYGFGDDKRIWVGTIPPTLKERSRILYDEVALLIQDHRERRFRERKFARILKRVQNKSDLADGRDILLCGLKSKAERSGDNEKSLEVQTS